MLWDRCLSVLSVCPVCNVGVLWPDGWMDQDAPGRAVGLGPGDIVLHGEPAPLSKRGHSSPHVLAHVYCGQTVRWIKMPLGMEEGLGPLAQTTLC